MDIFDKFFSEFAYKFDKGYPDMNDKKDIDLLENIINNYLGEDEEDINIDVEDKEILNVKKEEPKDKEVLNIKGEKTGGSKIYNDTIRYTLYGDEYESKVIPRPNKKYQYSQSSFSVGVDSSDMGIFSKLYPAKPPKVGKEVGSAGSLGVGNGEIALYWLYHFSDSANVEEGRSGDDPDLFFNGQGVEVKSWDNDKGKHGLGRFGADKVNLSLLSIIFGFDALSTVFGKEGSSSKTVNPTNFNGSQLEEAMKNVKAFKILTDKNPELASEYPLFKSIVGNLDVVYDSLNISNSDSPKEMAIKMTIKLLEPKLIRKPGDGNHLVNVKSNGEIRFFHILLSKLEERENLLNDFEVRQSAITIDFDKIWG